MTKKEKISKEKIALLTERVAAFNEANKTTYQVRFRGKFCYISRIDNHKAAFFAFLGGGADTETHIGRLEYSGNIEKMEFAVYRYSRETYDPDEFLFPGSDKLDGTIEGALRAGFELYP